MTFPDDLPRILEYRVGATVRTTLPRSPVQSVSTSGKTDACLVCPQIPHGCDGWRRAGETAWRPLSSLPRHWMLFLDRERGGPMDFRPAVGPEEVNGAAEDVG